MECFGLSDFFGLFGSFSSSGLFGLLNFKGTSIMLMVFQKIVVGQT
jgi:hypothetical protein